MSGFEIAGVVLAILPLLRGYGQIYDRCKAYGAYHQDVGRFRKKLLIVKTTFYREVEILFERILNEDTAQTLLQNPRQDVLDTAIIQNSPRETDKDDLSLGSLETLKAILELASETLQKLNSEGVLTDSPAQDLLRTATIDKKLRWSFSKKDRVDKLLQEMREHNEDLKDFNKSIASRTSISAFRNPSMAHLTWSSLSVTQKRYASIYQVLSPIWDHGCENISLSIGVENGSVGHSHLIKVPEEFSIMIGTTRHRQKPKLFELTLKVHSTVQSPKNAVSRLPVARSPRISKFRGSHSRQQNTERSSGHDAAAYQTSEPKPISHLSNSLSQAIESNTQQQSPLQDGKSSFLGYFEDSRCEIFEAYITSYLATDSPPSQSLADLLAVQQTLRRPESTLVLDHARRYYLAYTLGLSLLRLYSSPWLHSQDWWQSDNIAFFPNVSLRCSSGLQNPGSSPVPHIATRTRPEAPSVSIYHEPTSPSLDPFVNNHLLFAFGVILLEIALGQRLVSLAKEEEKANPRFTEFLAAKRLEKEKRVTPLMGPRYHEAVSRCISCRFNTPHIDLRTEELQKEFYVEVVCQLRYCWEKF